MKYLTVIFLILPLLVNSQDKPIIDIHLHAYSEVPPGIPADWTGEPESQALLSPDNADRHKALVLDAMKRNNIVLGLASSTSMDAVMNWKSTAPDLIIAGIQTNRSGMPVLSVDSMKSAVADGSLDVLGELGLQYFGVKPNDPRLESYYSLAEELGVPVCLHTGLGPPGAPFQIAPKFRITLGRPSLFEPVLIRHPKMKAFLAHAGWPYISETIAMMYIYTELYVDIGVLAWALPKEAFYNALEQMVDAGMEKRIMFGTDQMLWPGAIDIAVETIRNIPFLDERQKRDILYNNAARFLELPEEQVQQHHAGK